MLDIRGRAAGDGVATGLWWAAGAGVRESTLWVSDVLLSRESLSEARFGRSFSGGEGGEFAQASRNRLMIVRLSLGVGEMKVGEGAF